MSLFTVASITCPGCGEPYPMEVAGSVNADRRPDLRAAILQGVFQKTRCPSCAQAVRMQPRFTYLDLGRGQWIAAMPAASVVHYRAGEARAAALFDRAHGASAPARSAGAGLAPRLTFGWPALREKLLIRQWGLDDTVVETMKLDLLRRVADAPLRPGVEQRLVSLGEERMRFEWLGAADGAVLSACTVGLELYYAIADDARGWAATRALLSDGCFVDMQKAWLGDGQQARPA